MRKYIIILTFMLIVILTFILIKNDNTSVNEYSNNKRDFNNVDVMSGYNSETGMYEVIIKNEDGSEELIYEGEDKEMYQTYKNNPDFNPMMPDF